MRTIKEYLLQDIENLTTDEIARVYGFVRVNFIEDLPKD